ncbi:hypothetical protein [Mucilaginibacter ginkgonis]|uniref:Uncharacterized protein n=1 Tax=Mucilaginibacter ginkgonis TaxID=2682091 RepID=A0A6I4I1W1_9SPHI|nr:hypothetical protein [Mucilaginibacter ginkgonis]QQL50670.1 hypothetical protein GO620_004210 [Mucilaginibacter ginkgonis]
MKKFIITTGIMLAASLSFYAKQTVNSDTVEVLKAQKLSAAANLDMPFNRGHKMDIGQADAGN